MLKTIELEVQNNSPFNDDTNSCCSPHHMIKKNYQQQNIAKQGNK